MSTLEDEEVNCKEAECLTRISRAPVKMRTMCRSGGSPYRLQPEDNNSGLRLVIAVVFEVEFPIEGCDTYSEHARCFLARPLIELQGHFDVFPLLVADKIVQMLSDLPFDL